jgi:hypothetical protein
MARQTKRRAYKNKKRTFKKRRQFRKKMYKGGIVPASLKGDIKISRDGEFDKFKDYTMDEKKDILHKLVSDRIITDEKTMDLIEDRDYDAAYYKYLLTIQ